MWLAARLRSGPAVCTSLLYSGLLVLFLQRHSDESPFIPYITWVHLMFLYLMKRKAVFKLSVPNVFPFSGLTFDWASEHNMSQKPPGWAAAGGWWGWSRTPVTCLNRDRQTSCVTSQCDITVSIELNGLWTLYSDVWISVFHWLTAHAHPTQNALCLLRLPNR